MSRPDEERPDREESGPGSALERLLRALWLHHGLDFRDYARASLRRRVQNAVRAEGLDSIDALRERTLTDPGCVERLVPQLSVSVTSMFRDPPFWRELRARVLPELARLARPRIWHAGCATGEEVFSMAIALAEAGLLGRAEVLGTDLNPDALARARRGELPLERMRDYTRAYHQAGGAEEFSAYYAARGASAVVAPALRKRVRFARHNLATDAAPGAFDAVLCRNVLFYFNDKLQGRAQRVLLEGTAPGGFLGLGAKESLQPEAAARLEPLDPAHRLYRRAR